MCTTAVLEQTEGSRRSATPTPTPTPDLTPNHSWTIISPVHGYFTYVVLLTVAFTLLWTGTQAHDELSLLKVSQYSYLSCEVLHTYMKSVLLLLYINSYTE